jgi:hypothetical protein
MVDQRPHTVGAFLQRGCRYQRPYQGQALNALSSPFGTDFGAGYAPDFLGVGFEKNLVQPTSESV